MKKLISAILCICLSCSLLTGFTFEKLDREDVFSPELIEKEAVSDWAADEIEEARAAGLLTENTSFYLTRQITRAQFAELIVNMVEKAENHEIETLASGYFTDCDDLAIRKAAAAGIVNGMGEGLFAPDVTTNREQIATMISRATAYMDLHRDTTLTPVAGSIEGFADKDQVSDWAVDGVGLLAANNIMKGTSDTTLSPKSPCTVEQSILLALRVYNLT